MNIASRLVLPGLAILPGSAAALKTKSAETQLDGVPSDLKGQEQKNIAANVSLSTKGGHCVLLELPGIVLYSKMSIRGSAKLDALYIPTHRLHSIPPERIQKLSMQCKNIYVLASRHAKQAFSRRIPSECKVLDAMADRPFVNSFNSLTSMNNPSFEITHSYDLPLKRNYALRHARRNGHNFIGLIDDDIEMETWHIAKAMKYLQGGASMAGYYVFDFPDVSTIDHVDRLVTGDESFTIVGGNALFLNTQQVTGLFPYTYNEDWMFVFHNLESLCLYALGEVRQRPGAPWRNSKRIRFEEFGETVIEGFLALKQNNASIYSGTARFWSGVVRQRRCYLNKIHERCQRQIYAAALKTALHLNATLSGVKLAKFVTALEHDMVTFTHETH